MCSHHTTVYLVQRVCLSKSTLSLHHCVRWQGGDPLRWDAIRGKQGRDSMGSDATLRQRRRDSSQAANWQNPQSERFKPDCKMAKSISLTTPCCKVTGRRHRVSPCRSAYFASPWWLLTLDLVDVVEKQLYYSRSRDGIWRCGSHPSLFLW